MLLVREFLKKRVHFCPFGDYFDILILTSQFTHEF